MSNDSLSDRILDAAAEAVMVTDPANRIVRVNPAFTRITGYRAEEALGASPSFLSSGKHSAAFYEGMWHALHIRGFWQGEIWNRRKSGAVYPEWMSINVLRDAAGAISHHVAFFSDITASKEGDLRLRRMAHYDALTGLGNRLLLRERLSGALATANEAGRVVAVLFIDLDRFKPVNDRYGHAVGDALLVAVAERIRQVARGDDTCFRQGGDEFVVLLPHLRSTAGLPLVARRLVKALARPFVVQGYTVMVGASVGIALSPNEGTTTDQLLEAADLAMYAAKRSERGQCSGGPFTENSSMAERTHAMA